jgi:hypothetical protein
MPRSRSKNKTLAVGEKVHAEVTRLQSLNNFRNHDETLTRVLEILRQNNLLQ